MARMRAPRSALGLACLLACGAVAVAGCGGGSSTSSQVNKEAETGKSRPAPPKSAFPATEGRTLATFRKAISKAKLTVKVSPSAEVFYPGGTSRYPFLVAEKNTESGKPGKEVDSAEVAIYYSKVKAPVAGAGSRRQGEEGAGNGVQGAPDRPVPGADRIAGDEAGIPG